MVSHALCCPNASTHKPPQTHFSNITFVSIVEMWWIRDFVSFFSLSLNIYTYTRIHIYIYIVFFTFPTFFLSITNIFLVKIFYFPKIVFLHTLCKSQVHVSFWLCLGYVIFQNKERLILLWGWDSTPTMHSGKCTHWKCGLTHTLRANNLNDAFGGVQSNAYLWWAI